MKLQSLKIQETLHESPSTIIYRCTSIEDGTSYILKMLSDDHPSYDALKRLEDEFTCLKTMESMSTENKGIIKAISFIREENKCGILLEDNKAQSLNTFSPSLNLQQLMSIFIETAGILEEIHAFGYVHRDINPSNILWNDITQEVTIIDFGLASNGQSQTADERLEGTLQYISPEQSGRMNVRVDHRSDIYSFGATMYMLVTGNVMFPEYSAPLDLIHQHLTKLPEAPVTMNPNLPRALSDIIMKCLSKNMSDRYQSCESLREDLLTALSHVESNDFDAVFNLGEKDIVFKIPRKLYGNSDGIAELTQAMTRPLSHRPSLILVSGLSGSGKTYTINMIRSDIALFNISGKCDQYRRNIPYMALVMSFQNFIQKIMIKGDVEAHIWKRRLETSLGSGLNVLKPYIPELEHITGPIDAAPELTPVESKARLKIIFSDLVSCITDHVDKFVLFLDDIQWIDNDSIELLEYLVEKNTGSPFILLCAHRSETYVSMKNINRLTRAFKSTDCPVTQVETQPFTRKDIMNLIDDLFKGRLENASSLIDNLADLTQGNPLFTITLLEYYKSIGVLTPAGGYQKWAYNPQNFSIDVDASDIMKLMSTYIKRLPVHVQKHLQIAAFIGTTFKVTTIELVDGSERESILYSLGVAEKHSLIMKDIFEEDRYHFIHDQIQKTASQLNIIEPAQLHYTIGSELLKHLNTEDENKHIFDIANHFQSSSDLLEADGGRTMLRNINFKAATAALSVSAFNLAYDYMLFAMDYDPEHKHYTFAAQCAMLCGHYDMMDRWIEKARSLTRNPLELVSVGLTEISSFLGRDTPETAIEKGIELLDQLGYKLPSTVSTAAILYEVMKTQVILPSSRFNRLKTNAPAQDPRILAVMDILSAVSSACYLANPNLYLVVALRQTQLAFKYGVSQATGIALSNYSLILCAILKKYEDGYNIGLIARELALSSGSGSVIARTNTHMSLFTLHWKVSLEQGRQCFFDSYKTALENGDLEYVGWAIFGYAEYAYFMGLPLETVLKELRSAIEICRNASQQTQMTFAEIFMESVNLWTFSQSDYLQNETDDPSIAFYSNFNNMIHAYLLKDNLMADQYAEAAFKYIGSVISTVCNPISYFYSILIFIRKRHLSHEERKTLNKRLKELKRWAAHAPDASGCMYQIAQAAYAGILLEKDDQLPAFEAAISMARRQNALQYEALAHELASEYADMKGMDFSSRQHIKQAYVLYKNWGATKKLIQMQREHAETLSFKSPSGRFSGETMHSISETQSIDFTSLIKTTQSLSEQMELNGLLNAFNEHIIKNAGATTGALFIECEHNICMRSKWSIDEGDNVSAKQFEDKKDIEYFRDQHPDLLPYDFINYAWRVKKVTIYDRDAKSAAYADDPYFKNYPTDSIMSIPILLKGKCIGVLYLENSLTNAVFSEDRLAAIQVIVGQLAISYENARLYEEMENKVKKRTHELNEMTNEYYRLSIHDQLTKIYNRRKLDEVLKTELNRLNRSSEPLSVILLDIDHFKHINDRFGHITGDAVLIKFAETLKQGIRSTDTIGRWGGEEFLVICPNTPGDHAKHLAEKLRLLLEKTHFGIDQTVTSSFGVSMAQEESAFDNLLLEADYALYTAKENGRNQVVYYNDGLTQKSEENASENLIKN